MKIELIEKVYEWHNKEYETTCGLYHVKLNDDYYYLLRNNESVGVIQHLFSRPATECISIIKEDVKQELFKLLRCPLEDAESVKEQEKR